MENLAPASLLGLTFVSDPQLSVDGERALAVVTRINPGKDAEGDFEAPSYESRLELFALDGADPVPFTAGTKDSSPRFSPDGRFVAFLSRRGQDDAAQLYLMPTTGGEAQPLTSLKAGVGSFAWRPDSAAIAFVSRGDWQDEASRKGSGRVFSRIRYRADGEGFLPGFRPDVYEVDLDSREPRVLFRPSGSVGQIAWSPDGSYLYYTAAQSRTGEEDWYSALWRYDAAAGRSAVLVDERHPVRGFSLSPDGTRAAFQAPADPDNLASATGLWLWREGAAPRLITGGLEVSVSAAGDSRYGHHPDLPCWTDDGSALLVLVNAAGRSLLHSLDPATGETTPLVSGDRVVSGFAARAGRVVFTAEKPVQPAELFALDDSGERRLSGLNTAFTESHDLRSPETHAGPPEFWVLRPRKPRSDNALVLQVHGGPHTNYGYGFMFEFQLMAARGYTVVYGNPRGSSSYGTDYASSMLGSYGTIDADDVLATARAARAAHVDSDAPMHLTGGSYGGFMTNWLVARTGGFRSAVTQRSICNFVSFYGTSDIGYRFSEYEVGGNAWDDTARLWDQSPLKYVRQVETPVLIIHSEQDLRCPMEQAEQWFTALKRIGKAEARLVRFPDENHELSRSGRPDRRIQRLEEIISWFERHP